jgi:DNA-directed RNA polymerase alpha subunit
MKKRDDEIFADLKRYVGNVTVMVMIGKKKRKLSLNGGIIPLEMLDLSPRAIKALYGMNCETLNDALSVDFEAMLSLENVGAKSLREIAAKVSDITGEAWPFVDKNGQESNPKLKFDLKGETIRRFNNNKAAIAAAATVGP